MRSSSAWAAKRRIETLTRSAKVQITNSTANVLLGIPNCRVISYRQSTYKIPKCQAIPQIESCKNVKVGLPRILSGGSPGSIGSSLPGGVPDSIDQQTLPGDIITIPPLPSSISGGTPTSIDQVVPGGGPTSNGPILSGGSI
jgi:hypothetical protein